MKKIRRFLITSSLLVLQSVAAPLSASAQVIWVHRKYNPETLDHLYTTDINEAPEWNLEAVNYLGLSTNNSDGRWWFLNRYYVTLVNPAQHAFLGQPTPGESTRFSFEGVVGYYYPHQNYNTCVIGSFYPYCFPNCNIGVCPAPPGMRLLYSLWYADDSPNSFAPRRYMLTTSKEERDQLLRQDGWMCSIYTVHQYQGPTKTPNEGDCVLGFVY